MKADPAMDREPTALTSEPAPQAHAPNLSGTISRRQVLIGLAALTAQAGLWSNPLFGYAQPSPAATVPPQADLDRTPEAAAFLTFSKRITGHVDLRLDTASRIDAAMRKIYPDFAAQSRKLTALLQTDQEPKALLAAASDAGLRDVALAIVAAWYTGTIGSGQQAVVVSYAQALMYQPVSDGMTVPTYCNYGPLWWTRAPPAIRVSAPVAKAPAPAPATTGTPEPKAKT